MIVEVAHPAPISYTPRRGRVIRHALVHSSVSTRVAELSAAECPVSGTFAPVAGSVLHDPARPLAIRDHAGVAWIPLAPVREFAPNVPIGASEVSAFLAGTLPEGPVLRACTAAFWQSPIVASADDILVTREGASTRGEPEPPAGSVRIEADGREAAAAAAVAHLRRELVMIDGAPWVRFRPILHPHASLAPGFQATTERFGNFFAGTAVFDPQDAKAAMRHWGYTPNPETLPAADRIVGLRTEPEDNAALLLNLNAMARQVGLSFGAALDRRRRHGAGVPPGLLSRHHDAQALARAGSVGGIAAEDALAASVRVRDDADLLEAQATHGHPSRLLRSILDYTTGFAIPKLISVQASFDPGDVESLGHLAP